MNGSVEFYEEVKFRIESRYIKVMCTRFSVEVRAGAGKYLTEMATVTGRGEGIGRIARIEIEGTGKIDVNRLCALQGLHFSLNAVQHNTFLTHKELPVSRLEISLFALASVYHQLAST